MVCPNCGSNMSDKKTQCERCGTDLTLYRKIIRTSNSYYNNGLARAKVHDLSGAVVALRKCLELNKMHTSARNLLGLTYFAMGETVSALSEWVISKHFQPGNNDANEYIQKIQANPTRLDTINQAIKRYNSALTFSKQGSEDLAIIQLKKVVTLNPNFIRAYQLLALLHMKCGEYEKAKRYLNKASKIDVSNTTTLRFMRELESPAAKDMELNPEAEHNYNYSSTIVPVSTYREDKPNIIAFVNLVIGVLIGLAFMAFLGLPSLKNNNNSNTVEGENKTTTQVLLKQKEDEIKDLTTKNSDLNNKIKDLQTQIDTAVVPGDVAGSFDAVLAVTGQYITELGKSKGSRDFTAIADSLAAIDDTKLDSEAATNLLKSMRDTVYPDIAGENYHKGHLKYNSKKYDEAVILFKKAMQFDSKDVDYVYFVARCYDYMDDNTNATLYYNKVITGFPDSDRVKSAKQFLNKIQG